MAFDDTEYGTLLNTDCSTAREEFLINAIDAKFGESSRGDAFLNTAFRDAGGQIPTQMAQASFEGLNTAMCLLNPISGC